MQEIQERIRVWPSLSQEVYADLVIIAQDDKRKVAEMAAILIENAIKERKRKRKNTNAKEDPI